MGIVLGKVTVETPSHAVVRAAADGAYEIRQYGSSVAAEVRSADWAAGMSEREFSKVAFPTLARYIGVFGDGENVARGGGADADGGEPATATTAGGFTMAFLLPSKYKAAADAPRPTNDKVHLMDVPPRTVAVRKYSGNTTMGSCWEQVKGLLDALARDGVATTGPWTLQRYNPPFSLPWTKTNEIHVPVEVDVAAEAAPGERGASAAAVPA